MTLRSQDGVSKDKGFETEVPMEQRMSRMEERMADFLKSTLEFHSNISRQLSELMATMNRTRDDKFGDDRSTLGRYSPSSQKAKGSESDNMAEHGTVNLVPEAQEENPNVENHEGCEQTVILEKESIPQSKVPIANSEILKSIEPGKVDLGLENLEYAVVNGNLEQDWVQKNVKTRFEADGDVERGQKVMSNTKICFARQLFDQMPSKEKRSKHIKAWKFKFKLTSKRSKLMDDMLSFMEETSLLNKDPKETSWDCVKKEFKETVDACVKKRVDRFKLVEEKESKPEVLNLNQTCLYHQIGHGVDILLAFKMLDHDKERAVVLQRPTSLTIRDCPGRTSRANRVWKPGGLLCVQDHSGGSALMITQQFHGLQLQRIIYMDMKFQEVLIDDVLSVMVCLRMDETSNDLLLLNGRENEGCLNGSQALVLMRGITESSSRIEELMKEEPDFVKVNEVKKEKQKQRKCSKSWMYKFKMDSEPAGTSYLKRHKGCDICAQIRREKKQSKLLLLSLCPSFRCRAMLRVTVKQRKHSKTWSFKYKQQGNFRLLRCVGERTRKDIVAVTSCRSCGLGKKFLLLNLEVKVSLRGKI